MLAMSNFNETETVLVRRGRGLRIRVDLRAGRPEDHGYRRAIGWPIGQSADYRKSAGGALAFHLQIFADRYEIHLDIDVYRHPCRHALEVALSWRKILALRRRHIAEAGVRADQLGWRDTWRLLWMTKSDADLPH